MDSLTDSMVKFKNVLLVDDDYVSNFIADHLLTKLDLCENLTFCRNGDEALKYLKSAGDDFPEVIFLDINMPVMDGFEFIETFQRLNLDKKKTRIIIYTSSFSPKDLEVLKNIGFNDFIIKPLTEEKLMNVLKLFSTN
ncbi:MAG: response regulator [Sporocytophaga sp.]|uniref:response regulator n=1 Tax=Sporocytophaga sp. TaxID=2231183 RepID=UPI001B21D514|nr:response regulator [Sporocytophaga sp.]MBO9698826.1 response regulator [Sporocytophaga sp.]